MNIHQESKPNCISMIKYTKHEVQSKSKSRRSKSNLHYQIVIFGIYFVQDNLFVFFVEFQFLQNYAHVRFGQLCFFFANEVYSTFHCWAQGILGTLECSKPIMQFTPFVCLHPSKLRVALGDRYFMRSPDSRGHG